ncbi:LmeA family phospholipid-binding protein [Nocardia callitridis]|uniref:Mannan chain length control protein LmeA n=1 Tax=Nocardia callitridis TaxID=648753 RepID=A0ABP9KV86_9NOCA
MRKLIIGLVCLACLAVVVDFGAAAYSEYRVSRTLRVGADLTADPEVTIHGFPFLIQSLRSRYDVDIEARGNRQDIPGEVALEATLHGVRLPLSDLIDGNLHNVPVEEVEGRFRVEPTELGRLFNIPDLQLHSRPADKSDGTGGSGGSGMTTTGALVLTGTLPTTPGTQFGGKNVSVQADLLLEGDQVKIIATGLYHPTTATEIAQNTVVPEADRPAVLARFTRTIDTIELPFGVRPTKVSAQGGQIVVEGKGVNATIDLDRLQQP